MKCLHCGIEMINTVGGCYHCPTCGFGVDDCVLRIKETTSTADAPTPSVEPLYSGATGWICPRCGRGVAPWAESCSCHIDTGVTNTVTKTPSLNDYIDITDKGFVYPEINLED